MSLFEENKLLRKRLESIELLFKDFIKEISTIKGRKEFIKKIESAEGRHYTINNIRKTINGEQ